MKFDPPRVFEYDYAGALFLVTLHDDESSFLEKLVTGNGFANCSWRLSEIEHDISLRNSMNWREITEPAEVKGSDEIGTAATLEQAAQAIDARIMRNLTIENEELRAKLAATEAELADARRACVTLNETIKAYRLRAKELLAEVRG